MMLVRVFGVCFWLATSVLAEASCPNCQKKDDKNINQGLDISLVSENTVIEAGKPFRVGLWIRHEEKYHTYWKNPGVVGVPTHVKWTLPEGFSAEAIQWPYPELSQMAAYPCYGYERDILLMMEITPPHAISGDEVTLTGVTNWMCCAQGCFPGYETFSLTLPVGEEVDCPQFGDLFKATEEELPQENEGIRVELSSAMGEGKIQMSIFSQDDDLKVEHVFNEDGQTTPDLPYAIKKIAYGEHLFISTRSKYGPKEATSFPCILKTNQGYFRVNATY